LEGSFFTPRPSSDGLSRELERGGLGDRGHRRGVNGGRRCNGIDLINVALLKGFRREGKSQRCGGGTKGIFRGVETSIK